MTRHRSRPPSVDISDEDPFVALERLGLKIINSTTP
jgi:hypothetical protein